MLSGTDDRQQPETGQYRTGQHTTRDATHLSVERPITFCSIVREAVTESTAYSADHITVAHALLVTLSATCWPGWEVFSRSKTCGWLTTYINSCKVHDKIRTTQTSYYTYTLVPVLLALVEVTVVADMMNPIVRGTSIGDWPEKLI